jgi:hypothetical protein
VSNSTNYVPFRVTKHLLRLLRRCAIDVERSDILGVARLRGPLDAGDETQAGEFVAVEDLITSLERMVLGAPFQGRGELVFGADEVVLVGAEEFLEDDEGRERRGSC